VTFIVLRQANGEDCYVNVAEIRALFPAGNGTSINIGTMGNIPVVEKPLEILDRIAQALGTQD
jgi:restriction endonuclease S subunit